MALGGRAGSSRRQDAATAIAEDPCIDEQARLVLGLYLQEPRTQITARLLALHGSPGEAAQAALMAVLGGDPVLGGLPPRAGYMRRLFKHLIIEAEEEGLDLDEELVEAHAELLLEPGKTAQWGYKTYYYSGAPSGEEVRRLAGAQGALLRSTAPAGADSDAAIRTTGGLDAATLAMQALRLQEQPTAGSSGAGSTAGNCRNDCASAAGARQLLVAADSSSNGAAGGPESQEPPASAHPAASVRNGGGAGAPAGCLGAGLVTLLLSDNLFEGSTGCHEWEAGFFLGEALLSCPGLVAGKACLELGCGAGLLGLCALRAGAGRLLLTDGDALAAANCCHNLRLNGAAAALVDGGTRPAAAMQQHTVACCQLDWRDLDAAAGLQPDVILASDVLYAPELVPLLLGLLQQLMRPRGAAAHQPVAGTGAKQQREQEHDPAAAAGPGGTPAGCTAAGPSGAAPVAYIAAMLRNEATWALFLEAAAAAGFAVRTMQTPPPGAPGAVRFQQAATLRERGRVLMHELRWEAGNVPAG